MIHLDDTIAAVATGANGAISLIRISGKDALDICGRIFRSRNGRTLKEQKGYTITYGEIINEESKVVDDVLVSVFKSPKSYTGDDMAEISCHGSKYIAGEIMRLLINNGARSAEAGEFTTRAFLAGKIDLSQAEAVADIISSTNKATHALASNQMRGGYSGDLSQLRNELLRFTALIELELDFSEEDVNFADRHQMLAIIDALKQRIEELINSFSLGNAIKEGVRVAIVGSPNVGKSTLLNRLLNDDRAMVSDIAGTTRDVIEETINIGGINFRFIDTAGIRNSDDSLEQMGIERSYKAIDKANIILLLLDKNDGIDSEYIIKRLSELPIREDQKVCVVINKCDEENDCATAECCNIAGSELTIIPLSAKYNKNITALTDFLVATHDTSPIYNGDTVIANARHHDALVKSLNSLLLVEQGISTNLSGDLISHDLQDALYNLGSITGEITTDEVLGEIFSKFCIGK